MNVQSIKLLNGEEILVNLVSASEGGFVIKDPLLLQHGRDPKDGTPILGFVQWSLVTALDAEIVIPLTAVSTFPTPVQPEVENSYIKNTTGIDLPATKQILLS